MSNILKYFSFLILFYIVFRNVCNHSDVEGSEILVSESIPGIGELSSGILTGV